MKTGTTKSARLWAAVLGAGVIAAAAALAGPVSADGSDGLPPGDYTAEQRAFATELVERTERDLPAFADATKLPAMGYLNFGATVDGFDHWGKPDLNKDEHVLDPRYPESLVFRWMPDGSYQLQAAMFFLRQGADMHTIPAELAFLPGWHSHNDELCVKKDGSFAALQGPNRTCAAGVPSDLPPMMHVWIVDTPCGHRFGEIGIGGLKCGGHDDHHGPGGTWTGGPDDTWFYYEPGGTWIDDRRPAPMPESPPSSSPAASGTTPPATAVRATPNFTG